MAFLDKNGLQNLTNKLVQGDAIKVASHRGHNVKNVIDNIERECMNVANPLEYKMENRVAEFKIGQGRDTDVSGDVETGKTEVEFKGRTYQNLDNGNLITCGNGASVSNGIYTLKGDRQYSQINFSTRGMLKGDTSYVVILECIENTLTKNVVINTGGNQATDWENIKQGDNSTKIFTIRLKTTPSQPSRWFWIEGDGSVATGEYKLKLTIIEGDHTQTPIEELPNYFEGIQSSFEDGVVDIDVVGKNLFDINMIQLNTHSGYPYFVDNDRLLTIGANKLLKDNSINFEVGEIYSIRAKFSYYNNTDYCSLLLHHTDGTTTNLGSWGNTIPENGERIISHSFKVEKPIVNISYFGGGNANPRYLHTNSFQIEMSSKPTQYEPYYKKKISFNIGEPLRSLPNGVADEIRNNNGQWELVRRVGKGEFKSNWHYNQWAVTHEDIVAFYTNDVPNDKQDASENEQSLICNRFPQSLRGKLTQTGTNYSSVIRGRNYIGITLKKSLLSEPTREGFLQWIANNPTTVYHELITPTITPIEPIEFDIKPLSTMTINSHIAPTSFHTVQLNRASQIERGIVDIAELKNRVESLETTYDGHFLEVAHKLSLLGFEYDMEVI